MPRLREDVGGSEGTRRGALRRPVTQVEGTRLGRFPTQILSTIRKIINRAWYLEGDTKRIFPAGSVNYGLQKFEF